MKLPILLTTVLLLTACAETVQTEKAAPEEPVSSVAEFRRFFRLNNHDAADVIKLENGSFEIARYYFYGTNIMHPFQLSYTRKWRGTYNELGQAVVTYETCSAPQGISDLKLSSEVVLVSVEGEAISLERLDGFTQWLNATEGMTATEDVDCDEFP